MWLMWSGVCCMKESNIKCFIELVKKKILFAIHTGFKVKGQRHQFYTSFVQVLGSNSAYERQK